MFYSFIVFFHCTFNSFFEIIRSIFGNSFIFYALLKVLIESFYFFSFDFVFDFVFDFGLLFCLSFSSFF